LNPTASLIDVARVLHDVPTFDRFCSVEKLFTLVETLCTDSTRFAVTIAGRSVNGLPIHHVRYGEGSVKALLVGFPHCDEPIGGLTVYSLMTLLAQGNETLVEADVEWHIIPCIDPDGAILNEGWSQRAFTLDNYLKNFHKQELSDQVECSFQIAYKDLLFDRPTQETMVLKALLDTIRPDFYYPLHNAWAGGAFYFLTRDIDQQYHRAFYDLLKEYDIPLQVSAPHRAWCAEFDDGIYEMLSTRKIYDVMERTTPSPAQVLKTGACSWEYLADIKSSAMTFVTELPYLKHPHDGSRKATTHKLRQLKLRIDADNKFLITAILEEWDVVKADLDTHSPFYKKIVNGVISCREQLQEGLPAWPQKTRETLFNPAYAGNATQGERLDVYLIDRFYVLCHSYEFVRLLRSSTQTPAVKQATARLEALFDEALSDIKMNVDAGQFKIVDCDTLARVQLGSGLIVLNALLEQQGSGASR
jgi:hypothetical protein